ncbi:MAG: glutamate-5-semialdehyde dehydrogenase [Halobacteriales archaeon]|nr:glutamate-5-semialdehyde dehydrogenase [Halobacteriales archaeon]
MTESEKKEAESEKDAETKAKEAESAALNLSNVSDEERKKALRRIAERIEESEDELLEANARDVEEAEELLERGEYTKALVDRLKLDSAKVAGIAEMVRGVAEQDDPIGRTLSARELDEGMNLYKVSVPIGAVGSVFESRPDALPQIASLCLRSGNAVILKGGSEAEESNRVLFDAIRDATAEFDSVPDGWVQLVESREDVETILGMDEHVDLLMPRGSTEFVRHVQDNTKIPVLGHTEGVCHVYADEEADIEMAERVAFDAKVDYPAACNAVETVLVHEEVADAFVPRIVEMYDEAGVEVRGDEATRGLVEGTGAEVEEATEEDWRTEYGDLIVSLRVVGSLEEATDHVNTYGSKHTDSIVTEDDAEARRFMENIDSASVFHNASTRFSDGFRYGLGAEVGISTGKTHARGPVGVEGLTTYKWYIEADGHVVGDYRGEGARDFTHREFDGEW